MNTRILRISIAVLWILVVGAIISPVAAQTNSPATSKISYPVAELGNCADKTVCKAYCDTPEHVDACLSFAEKNNVMSKEEIKAAKNFKKTGMTGPGGCKGKSECSTYCSGPDHMDECISFAEKNGLMSGEKLDEAKKVKAAISKGIKPPACGGKENCKDYCSSSEHVEECVTFGEAAGIIRKEDAEMIRKNGGRKGPEGPGDSNGDGRQRKEGQDRRGGQGRGGQGKGGPGGSGQEGNDGERKGPGGGKGGGNRQGPGGQGGPGNQGNGGGERSPEDGGGPGPGGPGQDQDSDGGR